MPEGDTVWRAAQRLRGALAGEVLTRCDIRVPRFATVDLTGETVDDVVSRGKHLLIRVGANSVHTHLQMEGVWHVYRRGGRWRLPAHQARIVLATETHEAVGFSLGITEVVRRDHEADVVGHLGPDLLGDDWDAGAAVANLSLVGDRPIGSSLIDQRNLAGIGNIYRSEVCFLRGVHPLTPVAEVSDLEAMVGLAHRMMQADKANVRRRRPWVYGRRGQPCRRCGRAIEAVDLDRQTVCFCPRCQPRC